MGEDNTTFNECDVYIDGKYFGQAETIELKTIQGEETPNLNQKFNIKSVQGTFDLSISDEAREKLKKTIDQVLEFARIAFSRVIEMVRKFCNDNPWLIKIIKRKIKHEKRVRNRQKLYNKRKTLGRKL